ncbi:D-cysteine desulfhydrase [Pseudomaricurvus alkylphenolicus]|uniref:D-cysteine desulfhydrase n=1 Tax=Pseudomaricurvus alkylphenolicus TaxID=1306991 RepID=UPI0014237A69|nr:D-cysteine desulfhydrase [Pseudomaricurvus alkylphenolicus]NIB38460.1 D-cysteine desulfhydrase [Pseudomaricurvus alkylphenolicus]
MLLSRFPRIQLAHRKTPLERLPRLSKYLGGPNIYIKRDDCTGLGAGGNKTRKLEFLMADALLKNADTVITAGAIQSGHARQTAAAAAKLGLNCELVIVDDMLNPDSDYRESGNMLLDRLFGAKIRHCSGGADAATTMGQVADEIAASGGCPYVIPIGGSNAVGSLGYIDCAMELITQANEQQLPVDHVVHATGSGGTQAGLLMGLSALNCPVPVLGIGVSSPEQEQIEKVLRVVSEASQLLGEGNAPGRDNIAVNCNYIGEGYGIPTESMQEAVQIVSRLEGILLDPVYTGKAMAGLIDLVRKGHFNEDDNIVFVHTGGLPGLFAYRKHIFQHEPSAISSG